MGEIKYKDLSIPMQIAVVLAYISGIWLILAFLLGIVLGFLGYPPIL